MGWNEDILKWIRYTPGWIVTITPLPKLDSKSTGIIMLHTMQLQRGAERVESVDVLQALRTRRPDVYDEFIHHTPATGAGLSTGIEQFMLHVEAGMVCVGLLTTKK